MREQDKAILNEIVPDSMVKTANYEAAQQRAKEKWNFEADQFNQWDNISEEEQEELVQKELEWNRSGSSASQKPAQVKTASSPRIQEAKEKIKEYVGRGDDEANAIVNVIQEMGLTPEEEDQLWAVESFASLRPEKKAQDYGDITKAVDDVAKALMAAGITVNYVLQSEGYASITVGDKDWGLHIMQE